MARKGVTQGMLRAPPSALLQEDAPGYAELSNELRSSIVRIQNIETLVNWFEPYGESPEASAVGTGFAAELIAEDGRVPSNAQEDPLFVTNAHVVRNAHTVKIQFPAVGQEEFDGFVPVIYEDHDLAVVKLVDPGPFLQYLKQMRASLRPLPIRRHEEIMGQTVAAIGFPLGSSTLKLSTGVIAGTEFMDGKTVFQCTAPISPGNSGGPLLVLGDLVDGGGKGAREMRVVGVNFAATTAQMAENVNYVIPAVHVQQLLREFQALEARKDRRASANPAAATLESLAGGEPLPGQPQQPQRLSHLTMRLAPIGALPVHASPALYAFGGCKEGVFISQISKRSALYNAEPRVEEMSFLTAVDGVGIDSFGMGRVKGSFLDDPVPFQTLMQIMESAEHPVELTTCKGAKTTKHVVSMVFRPEYEPGIRMVTEPHFDPSAVDYEVFADVTVMQLSQNHIYMLMEAGSVPPSYGRWLLEDNEESPRLVVSKVQAGSYASTVLQAGMIVTSVNGRNVSTLAEFREHFEPSDGLWRLGTERGSLLVVSFAESFAMQLAGYQQGRRYLLTPAVLQAAQKHGLVAGADQQQSTMKLAGLFSQMLNDAYAQGQASTQKHGGEGGGGAGGEKGKGGGKPAGGNEGALPKGVSMRAYRPSFLDKKSDKAVTSIDFAFGSRASASAASLEEPFSQPLHDAQPRKPWAPTLL